MTPTSSCSPAAPGSIRSARTPSPSTGRAPPSGPSMCCRTRPASPGGWHPSSMPATRCATCGCGPGCSSPSGAPRASETAWPVDPPPPSFCCAPLPPLCWRRQRGPPTFPWPAPGRSGGPAGAAATRRFPASLGSAARLGRMVSLQRTCTHPPRRTLARSAPRLPHRRTAHPRRRAADRGARLHDFVAYGEWHVLAMTRFQGISDTPRDVLRKLIAAVATLGGGLVLPVLAATRPGAPGGALVGLALGIGAPSCRRRRVPTPLDHALDHRRWCGCSTRGPVSRHPPRPLLRLLAVRRPALPAQAPIHRHPLLATLCRARRAHGAPHGQPSLRIGAVVGTLTLALAISLDDHAMARAHEALAQEVDDRVTELGIQDKIFFRSLGTTAPSRGPGLDCTRRGHTRAARHRLSPQHRGLAARSRPRMPHARRHVRPCPRQLAGPLPTPRRSRWKCARPRVVGVSTHRGLCPIQSRYRSVRHHHARNRTRMPAGVMTDARRFQR